MAPVVIEAVLVLGVGIAAGWISKHWRGSLLLLRKCALLVLALWVLAVAAGAAVALDATGMSGVHRVLGYASTIAAASVAAATFGVFLRLALATQLWGLLLFLLCPGGALAMAWLAIWSAEFVTAANSTRTRHFISAPVLEAVFLYGCARLLRLTYDSAMRGAARRAGAGA